MVDQVADSKEKANLTRPTTPPSAHGGQTAPMVYGAATPNSAKARQFVAFSFYKLMPDFRRLPREQQTTLLDGLVNLIKNHNQQEMLLLTYSCVGTRPDVDLMFWKISFQLESLQDFSAKINRLPLAGYLTTPFNYLAQSKRSTYVDKIDPGHDDARTVLVPGKRKYIFVYPFVKTREWYLLSKPARQGVMDEHIQVGNKYPSVKLNTTYSFGIDDQEFVVAFETDAPGDFLDLVQELRETEGSRYTLRDTPIFTCVQMPIEEIVRQLA
ncbi:MAG TPA: chlorite dismutase family protein [Phycisphaerae bacterium]|nr:chlorite dismutase family protein [Phycisphaerae bacterium]